MIIRILYWIAFTIAVVCWLPMTNIDIRRFYGRIFGTRIDTKVYQYIFYPAAVCVCVLCLIMFMG